MAKPSQRCRRSLHVMHPETEMAGTYGFALAHDKMKINLSDPIPGAGEIEAARPGDFLKFQNTPVKLLGPIEVGDIDLEMINPSIPKRIHPLTFAPARDLCVPQRASTHTREGESLCPWGRA